MCLQSECFDLTGVAPTYTNVAHKVLAKAANIKGAGGGMWHCVCLQSEWFILGLPYTPG